MWRKDQPSAKTPLLLEQMKSGFVSVEGGEYTFKQGDDIVSFGPSAEGAELFLRGMVARGLLPGSEA
jgi:hypothetical protein